MPLQLQPLRSNLLPELSHFWRDSFPEFPLSDALLRERVLGPPDVTSETALCVRDDNGAISAITLLVPPKPPVQGEEVEIERIGGLRWFGVRPALRGRGLGSELLILSCTKLASLGTTCVDFGSTPPYYLRPGVDIRQTSLISWLLRRGFEHYRTNFNMSAELGALDFPSEASVFTPDSSGYYVRRAAPEDAEGFAEFCRREWTEGWTAEGLLGLGHDPCSLFLAVKSGASRNDEEIVGFAVYEANQGLGSFGPTGVSPRHRGTGLGKRLLWATLLDMKALGRTQSQIGWVGPVEFYHRCTGAALGPVFWGMRKRLSNDSDRS